MPLRPSDLRKDRLYTRTQLLAAGMHRRVLASEAMVRVFPGRWMRTDAEPDLTVLAMVLQQSLRPGTVISHESAAELHGFPLPGALTRAGGAALHCRGPEGAARTVGGLLVTHPYTDGRSIRHGGITLSHPVVALQEIAARLSATDLVVCMDALAADRHGTDLRISREEMREMVSTLRGRGAPALRKAVVDVRERSWSPMETRMRLMLVKHGYPEPELNPVVRDPATGNRYYIDLAYPRWKIAIEYDSEDHRKNKEQWQRDLHKNEVLHQLGWSVLRISIADHRCPDDLFRRLDEAIRLAEAPGEHDRH